MTCPWNVTCCPWCADSEAAISQREIRQDDRIKALNAAIDQHAADAHRQNADSEAAMMSDPSDTAETKEQYQERMTEKVRQRLYAELTEKANKPKEADERHWTDKVYKPWPGAMGS